MCCQTITRIRASEHEACSATRLRLDRLRHVFALLASSLEGDDAASPLRIREMPTQRESSLDWQLLLEVGQAIEYLIRHLLDQAEQRIADVGRLECRNDACLIEGEAESAESGDIEVSDSELIGLGSEIAQAKLFGLGLKVAEIEIASRLLDIVCINLAVTAGEVVDESLDFVHVRIPFH